MNEVCMGRGPGYPVSSVVRRLGRVRTSSVRTFYQVKVDNRLFVISSEEGRQRFLDLVRNTPNKVFSKTNASWVKLKRRSDPYQEEIEF